MAEEEVVIRMSAKDEGIVRAWQAGRNSIAAYEAQLGKLDSAQSKNAKSAAEWDRIAQRTLKDIQTPQQRHNAKVAELNELLRRGKISEEQRAIAVQKSRDSLDSCTKALGTAHKANSDWLDGIGTKVSGAAAAYLSVSTAVGAISAGIDLVRTSNREWLDEVHEVAKAYDKMFRGFNIQSGLRGIEGDKAKERILNIAERAGMSEDATTEGAKALVSAGVSQEEASGGALSVFTDIINAQDLRGADPTPFAETISQYLQTQGKEVTKETMREFGVQMQSAGKTSRVKLPEYSHLAEIGAGLEGKLTQEEQVSTFSTLGHLLGPAKAKTQMQDIITNLSTAATKPDAVAALKKLKLKPTDIDFQGESYSEVMSLLQSRLEKLKPEERENVLTPIIERSNLSTFKLWQEKLPGILNQAGELNDPTQFEADVREGSSGRDAAAERQQLRRRRMIAERDTQSDLVRAELVQSSLEQGQSPIMQKIAGWAFDLSKELGLGSQLRVDDDAFAASVSGLATSGRMHSAVRGTAQHAAGTVVFGQLGGAAWNLATGNDPGGNILGAGQDAAEAARASRAGVDQRLGSAFTQVPSAAAQPTQPAADPLMQFQNDLLKESNAIAKETLAVMRANRGMTATPLNTMPPGKPAAAEAGIGNRGQRYGSAP